MKAIKLLVILALLFGCGVPSVLFPKDAQCSAYASCSAKPLEAQILKDLVGQVVTDPSPDCYFPSGWSWTIKSGDISYLTFIHETAKSSYYVALVTMHLKRYQMPVDVKVVLTYYYNNGSWELGDMRVNSLTFPGQRNYASSVQIYMDYDFFPSLVVKNVSGYRLFIAGAYTANGEQERFAVELEPGEESAVAMGPAPDDYAIHFAYRE